MDAVRTNPGERWYVVYTKPKEEVRAEYNLRGWNVETFNPKIIKKHRDHFVGRVTRHVRSLFPRYIFARFDAEKLLHKVIYTRGVNSVVSSDLRPLWVDEETIGLIKSRVGTDGYVTLGDNIQRGCRVVIKDGHFKGLSGIFEQSTKDDDRVVILLKSINYQAKVTVEKDFVQRERPEGEVAGAARVKPAHLYGGAYKVRGQEAQERAVRQSPGL
jgi:transcriptional antiterminator RfaH